MTRKRLLLGFAGLVLAAALLGVGYLTAYHYMSPGKIAANVDGSDQDTSSSEDSGSDGDGSAGSSDGEGPGSSDGAGDGASSPGLPGAGRSAGQQPPVPLVEHTSEDHGFAVSYPQAWEPVDTPPEANIAFLVANDQRDSLRVRAVDLGMTVDSEKEYEAMRLYTKEIVTDGEDVNVHAGPSRVGLAGLRGHVYVYSFTDVRTDERGVHSHYFLFDGDRMYTLVFQAIPKARYAELAPVFDAMADSFRTL